MVLGSIPSGGFACKATQQCAENADWARSQYWAQLLRLFGRCPGLREDVTCLATPVWRSWHCGCNSGVAQWLACWAHNPKVRGSKPRSATSTGKVFASTNLRGPRMQSKLAMWTRPSLRIVWHIACRRPVGLMDKASAPGAGDSRFESWAGHICFHVVSTSVQI
jgi:hypothetical protein